MKSVRSWREVASEASAKNKTIHMARAFGIMVRKHAENAEIAKTKYGVVYQGNAVFTQNFEVAFFQDLGSSPVSIEGGQCVVSYGLFDDHVVQQADAEKAYIQALLEGPETWVMLPEEAWPKEWYRADGSHVYDRPVVRMLRALYGHPDSHTLWEKHSFKHLQSV